MVTPQNRIPVKEKIVPHATLNEEWSYYLIKSLTGEKYVIAVKPIITKFYQGLNEDNTPFRNPAGEYGFRAVYKLILKVLTIDEYNEEMRLKRGGIEP